MLLPYTYTHTHKFVYCFLNSHLHHLFSCSCLYSREYLWTRVAYFAKSTKTSQSPHVNGPLENFYRTKGWICFHGHKCFCRWLLWLSLTSDGGESDWFNSGCWNCVWAEWVAWLVWLFPGSATAWKTSSVLKTRPAPLGSKSWQCICDLQTWPLENWWMILKEQSPFKNVISSWDRDVNSNNRKRKGRCDTCSFTHLLPTYMNSLLPSGGGLQYWSFVASGPIIILNQCPLLG